MKREDMTPEKELAIKEKLEQAVRAGHEVLTSGGNPSNRYSYLEHHWTIQVTAGSQVDLFVEGFRTSSPDGDDFAFEYSTNGGGTWNPLGAVSDGSARLLAADLNTRIYFQN